MRILIIYFSFSGNNRLLAEHLAKRLNNEIRIISRYHITEKDLIRFEPQINEFLKLIQPQ
jgi:flavodoxin